MKFHQYSKIIIFLVLSSIALKSFALILTSPAFENNGNIPANILVL